MPLHPKAILRVHRALLATLACLALLLLPAMTADAGAEQAVPVDPAAGTVMQLGADPTVRVARNRHCVYRSVTLNPRYQGGGGLVVSYLFLNGRRAAVRRTAGPIRISARRLKGRLTSFELVSEFADGRAASVTGGLRRCKNG
jgi:hypothetical protein